jgi:hypothetical protein
MTRLALAVTAMAIAAIVSLSIFVSVSAAPPAAPSKAAIRVTGPFRHENLDVYLIHGPSSRSHGKLVPLQKALDEKKVIVRETGTVSQLTIENVSDVDVYVQAGDIVKGGRQDRVLTVDLVLPPRSGRVDVASFCVEQGRWQKRGREAADHFEGSSARLAHKDLKIAGYNGTQGQVWSSVEKVQRQLETNVSGPVRGGDSPSSLQLTLESGAVQKAVAAHVGALAGIVDKHADAIGYAFAVNGALNSADVYASGALFRELWPRLLQACAVEAVAEQKPGTLAEAPPTSEVLALVAEAKDGTLTDKGAVAGTRNSVRDTPSRVLVESKEANDEEKWIRRGYIKK